MEVFGKFTKKEAVILAIILVLAFAIRFFPYYKLNPFDYDTYVHYSVVSQALERNVMPVENVLDGCPDGIKVNHPLGFYLMPWLIGHLASLKFSFAFSSLFFSLLTLFLLYILLKKVIGTRAGLIGVLFLAVCNGYIFRSHAVIYKGDNFVLVPLILSLIFGLHFLTSEKKLLYSILAGLTSAASVLFWQGYPYALIVYILSLVFFITFDFIKRKEISKNINYSLISIATQTIGVFAFVLLFSIKIGDSVPNYISLLVSASAFAFLLLLKIYNKYFKYKWKRAVFFIAAGIILLAIILLKKDTIISISSGFGLIRPSIDFYKNISELTPITLRNIFENFNQVFFYAIFGLVLFLWKPNREKAFLIAPVLASTYLLTTTIRFIFLGSIFFIPLTGVFFDNIIKWKAKLGYILLILLFSLSFFSNNPLNVNPRPVINNDMLSSLEYFKSNTNNSACLATIPDWGGIVQYYAKRETYISSTNQNMERFNKLSTFLFTNKSLGASDIKIPGLYIGLMPDDLLKINAIIRASNAEGMYADLLGINKINESSGLKDIVFVSTKNIVYFAQFYKNDTVEASIWKNNRRVPIKNIFVEIEGKVSKITNSNAEDNGCIYFSDYVSAYFNEKLCSTNMIKMLTQQKIAGLEHWHSIGRARIYKVV